MKRYLLFEYDRYYPTGGMNDFVKDFDDFDNAIKKAKSLKKKGYNNVVIYDQEERKEVVINQSVMMINKTIKCKNCKKELRKKAYTDSVIEMGVCPQCNGKEILNKQKAPIIKVGILHKAQVFIPKNVSSKLINILNKARKT